MYSFPTTAFGASFTVSVSGAGIAITSGLSPVVGRNIEEFLSNFSQAFGKPIDQVRKELEPLIAEINAL
ncbi:hypothetical protein [Klebsiella pneumoniae]|uniref:hypothetical protein n=1 Tax=Klebsiella pneumoniae TaxID=573 RepID=UPI000B3FE249|nr:hypothetical protein [Klebsiella pneumoniae]HDS7945375.1 hypothetical protein [Klebsiella pneumoniae subsp. pneumoniae]EJI4919233.1 hypothetical protein [Klebsiella pneumoniae]MCC7753575.1 hypothetical protein [Klebsiella pneumoniae]MCL8236034.1 hypothetical protein [Klebsiella pneumoniae]MDX4367175.1 hypothetical protein [Klebsiella pneumoniae]